MPLLDHPIFSPVVWRLLGELLFICQVQEMMPVSVHNYTQFFELSLFWTRKECFFFKTATFQCFGIVLIDTLR